MQKDSDVYVDSEDEVFFGCVSDKEKNIRARFQKEIECFSQPKNVTECNKLLGNNDDFNGAVGKKTSEVEISTLVNKIYPESVKNYHETLHKDENDSPKKNQDFSITYSNDSTVELEHNYSTPMKHKIDKTILATPKSIVKADKDGGFLKVLSEIALVKAEAEADKQVDEDKKEDEDKENKIVPEINIIEATPEKTIIISPPQSFNRQLRRFRIIYNQPENEESSNFKKSLNSNSVTNSDNLKNCQNLNNECTEPDIEPSDTKEMKNFISNDQVFSKNNQSINLIDFNESNILIKRNRTENPVVDSDNEKTQNELNSQPNETKNQELELTVGDGLEEEESCLKNSDIKLGNFHENLDIGKNSNDDVDGKIEIYESEKIKSDEPFMAVVTPDKILNDKLETNLKKQSEEKEINSSEDLNNSQGIKSCVQTNMNFEIIKEPEKAQLPPTKGRRFSKEARMIVEVLKKSTDEDTLNFTIQEIDVENEENSFLSPEPVPCFDETVFPNKDIEVLKTICTKSPLSSMITSADKETKYQKAVETDKQKLTPIVCKSKIKQPMYFSSNKNGVEVKKFEQNSPVVEKKKVTEEKNIDNKICEKDLNTAPSSKIPVFGVKPSKIPLGDRVFHSAGTKTTPLKTPNQKIYRNPKFDKIESPISAYINNKPTSLVLNVKSDVKKNCLTKVWTGSSSKKIPEKTLNVQKPKSATQLPFVEYKSGTPYKVEKRPESKLPQLAPTLKKLIGTHSPKILKHEGRFYVKAPGKLGSISDSTVVADSKEVSLLVSQTAQKKQHH